MIWMKYIFSGLLLLILATSGCTSRAKARAQARAAFVAGQQQSLARMNDARRTSIYVVGNVRYREIPWSEGLTLAQVLVAAECLDRNDPRQIQITRQRERIPVDPRILLRGDDLPLEPGDTVELHP